MPSFLTLPTEIRQEILFLVILNFRNSVMLTARNVRNICRTTREDLRVTVLAQLKAWFNAMLDELNDERYEFRLALYGNGSEKGSDEDSDEWSEKEEDEGELKESIGVINLMMKDVKRDIAYLDAVRLSMILDYPRYLRACLKETQMTS